MVCRSSLPTGATRKCALSAAGSVAVHSGCGATLSQTQHVRLGRPSIRSTRPGVGAALMHGSSALLRLLASELGAGGSSGGAAQPPSSRVNLALLSAAHHGWRRHCGRRRSCGFKDASRRPPRNVWASSAPPVATCSRTQCHSSGQKRRTTRTQQPGTLAQATRNLEGADSACRAALTHDGALSLIRGVGDMPFIGCTRPLSLVLYDSAAAQGCHGSGYAAGKRCTRWARAIAPRRRVPGGGAGPGRARVERERCGRWQPWRFAAWARARPAWAAETFRPPLSLCHCRAGERRARRRRSAQTSLGTRRRRPGSAARARSSAVHPGSSAPLSGRLHALRAAAAVFPTRATAL